MLGGQLKFRSTPSKILGAPIQKKKLNAYHNVDLLKAAA